MIRFRKEVRPYNCFSNFYPCTVAVDGMQFRSAEAAFQAQKVPLEKRRDFIFCTPSAAKHLGRHVPLPADWDDVRDEAMHKVVYAKFSKNENLRQILLSTEDEELVEDTTGWHDNIWGDCSCPKCQYIKGRNKLGKILMQVRDEIKTGKICTAHLCCVSRENLWPQPDGIHLCSGLGVPQDQQPTRPFP